MKRAKNMRNNSKYNSTENIFEIIFDKSPIATILVNVKTRKPIFVNQFFSDLSGYSEKEFLK